MWGFHDFGWGIGMLIWMLVVWAVVVVTFWFIFRELGGPRRRIHR